MKKYTYKNVCRAPRSEQISLELQPVNGCTITRIDCFISGFESRLYLVEKHNHSYSYKNGTFETLKEARAYARSLK